MDQTRLEKEMRQLYNLVRSDRVLRIFFRSVNLLLQVVTAALMAENWLSRVRSRHFVQNGKSGMESWSSRIGGTAVIPAAVGFYVLLIDTFAFEAVYAVFEFVLKASQESAEKIKMKIWSRIRLRFLLSII